MTLEEFAKYVLDNNCRISSENGVDHAGFSLCCLDIEYRYNRNTQTIEVEGVQE